MLSDIRIGYNSPSELKRIITRAGLEPWPRAWHNLRGSRQSGLAAKFPIATACAWIGNSRMVASGHYITTTDADWQRAIGGGAECGAVGAHFAAQHAPAPIREESRSSSEASDCDGVMRPTAQHRDSVPSGSNGRYRPLRIIRKYLLPKYIRSPSECAGAVIGAA